jgi:hypothetical protein
VLAAQGDDFVDEGLGLGGTGSAAGGVVGGQGVGAEGLAAPEEVADGAGG